jgi:hypothetical protein
MLVPRLSNFEVCSLSMTFPALAKVLGSLAAPEDE